MVAPSQTFRQVLNGKTQKLDSILGGHSLTMPCSSAYSWARPSSC
jgi:hypothetical protein